MMPATMSTLFLFLGLLCLDLVSSMKMIETDGNASNSLHSAANSAKNAKAAQALPSTPKKLMAPCLICPPAPKKRRLTSADTSLPLATRGRIISLEEIDRFFAFADPKIVTRKLFNTPPISPIHSQTNKQEMDEPVKEVTDDVKETN
ncbi:hypothetical protein GPALN_002098 [Globodera pallida]|nr:hypothetical protein GPALN_002098 [Globodera pallida]